nr:hypothetical protein [Haliscomenobacter sp.]
MIKHLLLYALSLILLSPSSQAQTYTNLLAGTPYEEESFRNIEIDPSGNIWAIVGGYKILKIAPNGTYTAYFNSSGNNNMPWHFWSGLEDLAIGPNGNIWVTNYFGSSQNTSGLRSFSPDFTLLDASTNLFEVNRIKFDQLGNLWIHGYKQNPTDEAIFKLPAADAANGSIEQSNLVEYDDDNSPLPYDQYLNTMALENPNTIWFGTQYDGVFTFDGSTWTQVIDDNFAPVTKLLFDENNNLLIGTLTSGIIIRKSNGDLLQYTPANSDLFSTLVDVLCVDNEGVVWLGSYDAGLYQMTNLNSPVQIQLPLLHQRVYDIARDPSGNIFVATLHGLLKFAALPPTILYPKITLSAFERQPGQNLDIMGADFTPDGAIKIVITAPGASSPQEILTTGASNGTFTYMFTAPSSPGVYMVKAIDLSSAKETLLKTFQVSSPPPPPTDYLQTIAPSATDIFFVGGANAGFIPVSYSDKMFLAGNTYPLSGAYRLYKYKIEYSINNGQWQYAGEQSGQHLVSQTMNATFQMPMPGAVGPCKIRITDLYNTNRTKTGPVFTLHTLDANALKVDFSWDYSYQTNEGKPIGAAADGVGRFYLGVSKPGVNLQSVSVSLSDDQGTTAAAKLGKVMPANITEYFSNEANTANATSAASTTLDALGTCWFWYVSPEDFTRNLGDFPAKERTVFLNVSATFSNGLMENIVVPIKVVRPPLMLAHGLGGDPSTWDNFKSANGVLVRDDPRFVVAPVAVSMLPTGLFEANAQLIRGLLESQIKAIRISGYACNQLDYVCHSMGGSVMRYCLSDSIKGSANPLFEVFFDPTRSYGKGLTHKIITLDTPHNGSPFADLLVRYKEDAFIKWSANFDGFFIKYKPTPAILNLQIDPSPENEGGINFSETPATTKAHLIAS